MSRNGQQTEQEKQAQEKAWAEVLGVTKEATVADINKAYRKQALLHHPDKNLNTEAQPDNQAQAEATMKTINAAHDGLLAAREIADTHESLQKAKQSMQEEQDKAAKLKQNIAENPPKTKSALDATTKQVDAVEKSHKEKSKNAKASVAKAALGAALIVAVAGGPLAIGALLAVVILAKLAKMAYDKLKKKPEAEATAAAAPAPTKAIAASTPKPISALTWLENARQQQASAQFTAKGFDLKNFPQDATTVLSAKDPNIKLHVQQGKMPVISIPPRTAKDMTSSGGLTPEREAQLVAAVDMANQAEWKDLNISEKAFNKDEIEVIQKACEERNIEFKLDKVATIQEQQNAETQFDADETAGQSSSRTSAPSPGRG